MDTDSEEEQKEQIVVEPPPPNAIFSIIFDLLADSVPKSFKDALPRPDSKFWWEALCAEITAVIQNITWTRFEPLSTKEYLSLSETFVRPFRGTY